MSYSDIHLFKFEVPHFLDDSISVQKFKSTFFTETVFKISHLEKS